MRILLLILAALLPIHVSAAAVATWPNFIVTPGGGGGSAPVGTVVAQSGTPTIGDILASFDGTRTNVAFAKLSVTNLTNVITIAPSGTNTDISILAIPKGFGDGNGESYFQVGPTYTPSLEFSVASPAFVLHGPNGSAADLVQRTASDSYGGHIFAVSGGTLDTPTVSSGGNGLGAIIWSAYDGSDFLYAASIEPFIEAQPTNSHMYGAIKFRTRNGGSMQDALIIHDDTSLEIPSLTPSSFLYLNSNNVIIASPGSPGGGGGNMTNSGASTAGNVAVALDSTGTQWTGTNRVDLDAIQTDQMLFSDLAPNGFAYLGSLTNLTNAPYIPMAASAALTNLSIGIGTSLTNLLGAAVQAAQTNVTLQSIGGVTTNAPAITTGSIAKFTGSNVVGAATSGDLMAALGYIPAYANQQATLTHAGTVIADFTATNVFSMSATGNVTVASTGLATNRSWRVIIKAPATNITIALPSWNVLGTALTTILATKSTMISAESWGINDTNVWYGAASQP